MDSPDESMGNSSRYESPRYTQQQVNRAFHRIGEKVNQQVLRREQLLLRLQAEHEDIKAKLETAQ